MPSTITATELAKNLSDVLNRVKYRGERFVIERNGEAIASINPTDAAADAIPRRTWKEIAALLEDIPRPDDRFADDLEAILAEKPPMQDPPEWPD